MVICKECQHENMVGAVFCAGCAAQLISSEYCESELVVDASSMPRLLEQGIQAASPEHPEDSWVVLHFLDSDETLPLASGGELTMGRFSDDQPVNPDIDLTPYEALAYGVSRLHLAIQRGATSVVIKDLGSSNGTSLNGRRLNPNMTETLKHGDIVVLSKMRVQILLHDR